MYNQPEKIKIEETYCVLQEACYETQRKLHISSLSLETEILGFFDQSNNIQLIDDLRKLSVDLSENDENIKQHETYLGLSVGAMISEIAGVNIQVLRYDLSSMTNSDAVDKRKEEFDIRKQNVHAERIKPLLPHVYTETDQNINFSNGASVVLDSCVRCMIDDELIKFAKRDRKAMKQQLKQFRKTSLITTADIFFI